MLSQTDTLQPSCNNASLKPPKRTCRRVLTDVGGHGTAPVVAAANLGGVLPHQLREVAGGAAPARVAEAVLLNLAVPCVDCGRPGGVAPAFVYKREQCSVSVCETSDARLTETSSQA